MTNTEKSTGPDLKETSYTATHHEEKEGSFFGLNWLDIASLPIAVLGLIIFFGTMAAITVMDSAKLISNSRMNNDCW